MARSIPVPLEWHPKGSVLENFWAIWTSETKPDPDPSEALFYRSGNSQRLFPKIKNGYGAVAAGQTAQKLSSTEPKRTELKSISNRRKSLS